MTEVLPDPYLYLHDPEEYLSSVRSKFPSIQIEPKVSLGLGVMEFKKPKRMRKELDKEPTRFGASWFGGQPFENGREWPRSSDGTLLTHIAQVDLGYESMNVGDLDSSPRVFRTKASSSSSTTRRTWANPKTWKTF